MMSIDGKVRMISEMVKTTVKVCVSLTKKIGRFLARKVHMKLLAVAQKLKGELLAGTS